MTLQVVRGLQEIVTQPIKINPLRSGRPPEMVMILLLVAHFMPDQRPPRTAFQEYSVHQTRIITLQNLELMHRYLPIGLGEMRHYIL